MKQIDTLDVPMGVRVAARTVIDFAERYSEGRNDWQLFGLIPVQGHNKIVGLKDARIAELEADRHMLQSTGEHPAPCARHCEANAFRIELRKKDARIAELEAPLRAFHDEMQGTADQHMLHLLGRIAELEKQAAIDKTLLALADARINRELRDDFAGRAMQGLISSGHLGPHVAKDAYVYSDAMLKAKGGV